MEKILIAIACIILAFLSGGITNYFRNKSTGSNRDTRKDNTSETVGLDSLSGQLHELGESEQSIAGAIANIAKRSEESASIIREGRAIIDKINKDNNLE